MSATSSTTLLRARWKFVLLVVGLFVAMVTTTASQVSANHYPRLWLGSPVEAQWPDTRGCGTGWRPWTCSLPDRHHRPYGGDWAVDFQDLRSNEVRHYSSRLSPNAGFETYAKVLSIRTACLNKPTSEGGEVVVVGMYRKSDNLLIAKAFYAHLNPTLQTRTFHQAGRALPTDYGYVVGHVGSYRLAANNECWKGKHLHYEALSMHGYACYWKGFTPDYVVHWSNFIGHAGGNYATAVQRPCP